MLYCGDYPKTKPDAKIKVDLLKDQHGRVLIATTGGFMSEAQSALVKKAMPLIEEAVFKDMGLNVYVQGTSLIMEQKVHVTWAAGVSLIPHAEPFPVYDPRKDPDLNVPLPKAHTKIKVEVSKDEDGNLLMIVEQTLTRDQKDTLYQSMRLFKGGDFSGPGFNVYLQGEDIVLERI